MGYQAVAAAAIKEARQLLAASGYAKGLTGVEFLIRGTAQTLNCC
jgi:hypothetical protein